MSPENSNNSLSPLVGTSIPKIIDFNNLKDLLWSEKQHITLLTCADQREAFRKTLEENLLKWIDIKTQAEYDYLKNLLGKYWIIPNLWDIAFGSINWDIQITIKKVNGIFKVYNNPDSTQPYSKWSILSELGEIKNWKFTEIGTLSSLLFQEKDSKTDNSPVPQDIWECTAEIKKEKPEKSPPKPKETPETHTEYKIIKWDFLWRIIKKAYWLSDKPEDMRCVWNIIELLKKDPRNVIKDETNKIFIWDTLHLPKEGAFNYKWRKPQTFKLLGNAVK